MADHTFAITDQRVAYQSGFFHRRGVSIPLNRVNNVNFSQNLMARLLNNGIVIIESAGESGDSVFENIPDPEHVRNIIFAQVEADEVADSKRTAKDLRDAMQGTPLEPPPAPGTSSTADRLQQLTELRDKGLVTPEEFEAKRQEIVGDLSARRPQTGGCTPTAGHRRSVVSMPPGESTIVADDRGSLDP